MENTNSQKADYGIDLDERILETSWNIEIAVNKVLDTLAKAGEDSDQRADQINAYSNKIASNEGEDIRGLVRGLLKETQDLTDRNRSLHNEMRDASSEISALNNRVVDIRRMALTDPLTGIANRKHLDDSLTKQRKKFAENGSPFCYLMIDIDFFKKFNDRFGHQMGDQVLKLVARTLSQAVGDGGVVARYGGEEFGILLPKVELSNAARKAEQLRIRVASCRLTNKKSNADFGNITLSIGVAEFRPGESVSDLIRRADAAVYAAKRTGRNRVEIQGMTGREDTHPDNGESRTDDRPDDISAPHGTTNEFRIVVADDNEDDRFFIKKVVDNLETVSVLEFAEDGVELLERLRGQVKESDRHPLPDVVFLDLNMPRLDGWQTLKEIRTDPNLRLIPVIILSSSDDSNDIRRTYDLGANSYIVKPIDYNAFVEVMTNVTQFWATMAKKPGIPSDPPLAA